MGKKKKKQPAKPKLTDDQKVTVEAAIKSAWDVIGWVLVTCEWDSDEGTYEVYAQGSIPGKHYLVGNRYESIKGKGGEVFESVKGA